MTAESFGPEQAVHGSSWGRMHGGYFSDPEVARPLVAAVRDVWAAARRNYMQLIQFVLAFTIFAGAAALTYRTRRRLRARRSRREI